MSDVAAALAAGQDPDFVSVDSRSTEAWDQGHVPGAVHLPTALVREQAGQLLDRSVPVVTYCWGPGCNGAARAGRERRTPDPLTTPAGAGDCGC